MLDLKMMQKNPEVVRESLEKRGSKIDVTEFAELDSRRKALIGEVEALKAEKNSVGPEIAKRKKAARTLPTCSRRWARSLPAPRSLMRNLPKWRLRRRNG